MNSILAFAMYPVKNQFPRLDSMMSATRPSLSHANSFSSPAFMENHHFVKFG